MKKLIILFLLLSFCLFYTFSQQDQYEIISEQKIEYRDVNSVYYHSPTSVVSYQQIVEDIDNLKYLLKTCYAGYEDAVQRGLDLEKFEQNILSEFSNSIYDKNSISTDKICDVVYNELKNYVTDNHFSIYGASTECILSNVNRVLYSNIYVREKNGKYFVVESDIPEIKKKSEFTGSKENLFLYPAKGKNIYRIGYVKTVENSKQKNIEEIIKINFDNYDFDVKVKDYDAIEIKNGWYFGEQETKKAVYVSSSSFTEPPKMSAYKSYFDKATKKYIDVAKNFNSKDYVIIDLRSNNGGFANYSLELFYKMYTGLYNENLEYQYDRIRDHFESRYYLDSVGVVKAKYVYLKNLNPKDEFLNEYINAINDMSKNPIRYLLKEKTEKIFIGEKKYNGKIIIIADRNTMSAAESTIICAKALFGNNCYLVGENSNGCHAYGGVYTYQLPNGSLAVRLSNIKYDFILNNKVINIEGIGFTPDYWSTNEDLLETLVAITGDKSLRKVLHGIEVGLK